MSKKMLIGSLLAAVAMFIWGFLFWTTPLGKMTLAHGVDTEAAQQALASTFTEEGVYFVPDMQEGENAETWAVQHRRGPLAMVFFRPGGDEPMAPTIFLYGFLHMFGTCLLIAMLVNRVGFALPTTGARVGFVALAGLAASFWGQIGDPIWFYHPWHYHLMSMAYDLVAWTLAGIVLARSMRS